MLLRSLRSEFHTSVKWVIFKAGVTYLSFQDNRIIIFICSPLMRVTSRQTNSRVVIDSARHPVRYLSNVGIYPSYAVFAWLP